MTPIKYTLTPEDVTAAGRFGFAQIYKENFPRNMLILLAVAAVVALVINLVIGFSLDEFVEGFIMLAIVYFICFVLFFPIAWYLLIPWRSGKTFKQMPSISREQQLSWDDDAVTFSHENGQFKQPFAEFYRWGHNAEAIVIYPASHMFYTLPRRIFPDSASYDALIRRLAETKAEQL